MPLHCDYDCECLSLPRCRSAKLCLLQKVGYGKSRSIGARVRPWRRRRRQGRATLTTHAHIRTHARTHTHQIKNNNTRAEITATQNNVTYNPAALLLIPLVVLLFDESGAFKQYVTIIIFFFLTIKKMISFTNEATPERETVSIHTKTCRH